MGNIAHHIVDAAWSVLPEGDPARRALAGVQDTGVRQALSLQNLRPAEAAVFGQRNLTSEELESIGGMYPVVETPDDVRELAAAQRLDRRMRRRFFADRGVYGNMTAEEQQDLALELEPGDGRDDLLIAVLPRWVGSDVEFDAESLLPGLGYLAGAYLLAAAGPDILSDERVLEIIKNPPTAWEHADEDRKWHQRAHVRDAMYMLCTHRPGLAHAAAADPDLVQYAMRSPHWDAEYAHRIRGFDLESGKLTSDASMNTPGTLLSLVWNPKTPLEQAERIVDIAEDGLNNTPFVDDWSVTAAASARRVEVQPWHVDHYASVVDPDMIARLERRLKSGILSAKVDPDKMLNGVPQENILWWPKRFEEGIAMITNTNMHGRVWLQIASRLSTLGTFTAPFGTWTREQLVAANRWIPASNGGVGNSLRGLGTPASPDSSARHLVAAASARFATYDEATQQQAWELLVSLAEDTQYLRASDAEALVDTTTAVFD